MELFLPGPLPDHARNLMRRLGYGELRKRTGQLSYVKRVQQTDFPRYHAYVEDRDGGIQINLHLDQKAASHEGTAAHAGEYSGSLVEKEMTFLRAWIMHWKQEAQGASTPSPTHSTTKKKSMFFWKNN